MFMKLIIISKYRKVSEVVFKDYYFYFEYCLNRCFSLTMFINQI